MTSLTRGLYTRGNKDGKDAVSCANILLSGTAHAKVKNAIYDRARNDGNFACDLAVETYWRCVMAEEDHSARITPNILRLWFMWIEADQIQRTDGYNFAKMILKRASDLVVAQKRVANTLTKVIRFNPRSVLSCARLWSEALPVLITTKKSHDHETLDQLSKLVMEILINAELLTGECAQGKDRCAKWPILMEWAKKVGVPVYANKSEALLHILGEEPDRSDEGGDDAAS